MARAAGKSPLNEYLDDLWETCDFPRPRQPSANMKAARLRAAQENELKEREDVENGGNGEYLDQLDPEHYRSVTEEIRKIRGERASDRNIEWIINRGAAIKKKTEDKKAACSPIEVQLVRDGTSTVDSECYFLPSQTESKIDVNSRRDFPELK